MSVLGLKPGVAASERPPCLINEHCKRDAACPKGADIVAKVFLGG